MKLPISPRLLACARLVEPGQRVADVGTDHGYLAIYLLLTHRASQVFAADVAEKPLARARENAHRFGVTAGLSFHLCDGVQGLPQAFDVLVMAGMGADTMVHILSGTPWLLAGNYRLILQCQSTQHRLRRYLSQSGWIIRQEIPVKDGRFLYTVISAVSGQAALTPVQELASPALLASGSPLVAEYLARCQRFLQQAVLAGGPEGEYYAAALAGLQEMEAKP